MYVAFYHCLCMFFTISNNRYPFLFCSSEGCKITGTNNPSYENKGFFAWRFDILARNIKKPHQSTFHTPPPDLVGDVKLCCNKNILRLHRYLVVSWDILFSKVSTYIEGHKRMKRNHLPHWNNFLVHMLFLSVVKFFAQWCHFFPF